MPQRCGGLPPYQAVEYLNGSEGGAGGHALTLTSPTANVSVIQAGAINMKPHQRPA